MGIIESDAVAGKAVLGLRIEFLSEHPGLRAEVLQRLLRQRPEHPFSIARSITVDRVRFKLVDDDIETFAPNLQQLLGGDAETRYRQRNDALFDDRNKDTRQNRVRFFQWWASVEPAVGDLEGQLRNSLIALLAVGPFTVEWWPDLTGPDDPPASVTAEPSDDPTILVFHTGEEPVERVGESHHVSA